MELNYYLTCLQCFPKGGDNSRALINKDQFLAFVRRCNRQSAYRKALTNKEHAGLIEVNGCTACDIHEDGIDIGITYFREVEY